MSLALSSCASLDPGLSRRTQAPKTVVGRKAPVRSDGTYYQVQKGDTLWGISHAFGIQLDHLARTNRLRDASQLDVGQQLFIPLPQESDKFYWPARGKVRSLDESGLAIATPGGSLVRSSRSGSVAVSTQQLSGWGPTIVIDHGDGYLSIYAGLEEIFVHPGQRVRQGSPIGRAGHRDIHFEIRRGTTMRDALALLPK